MMNKVLFLFCAYNEEKRLPKFFNSLRSQEVDLTIIALNDGSQDKTQEVLSNNLTSKDRLLTNKTNQGITKSFNSVVNEAQSIKSDYVTWCGVDEEIYPDAFNERIKILNRTGSDICITGSDTLLGDGRLIRYPNVLPQFARLQGINWGDLYNELIRGNFIPSPVMTKAEILPDLYLDLNLSHLVDWDLWIKLSRMYKFCFLDKSTQCSDWDGSNFSAPNPLNEIEKAKEMLYIYDKYNVIVENKASIRAIVDAFYGCSQIS